MGQKPFTNFILGIHNNALHYGHSDKLNAWLIHNKPRVVKDSLTGQAMTYLFNQWDKLIVYCTDGQLRISNILTENTIRNLAVGRRA